MTINRWDLDNAIRDARKDQAAAADGYNQALTALLEQYAGRRSAAAHLVREVADLAIGHAAEADRRAERLIEQATAAHTAIVAKLEADANQLHEHNRTLTRALDERRTIREVREEAASPEDTDVVITNGYHGWTVAGLEEVAYRLRCGGAVDVTPVEVEKSRATATVPAPNLVPLSRPEQREPAVEAVATPQAVPTPRRMDALPRMVGPGLALLVVLQLVLLVLRVVS